MKHPKIMTDSELIEEAMNRADALDTPYNMRGTFRVIQRKKSFPNSRTRDRVIRFLKSIYHKER